MTEMKLDFQKQGGLIPAIILDHTSKEVLMLAYLNEEAYHLTRTSGQMWYWSRSRQELWRKGVTSGHYQTVKKITADRGRPARSCLSYRCQILLFPYNLG